MTATTTAIPGGCFLWSRSVFQSEIWKKPSLLFKAFFWIVGNAAYEDGHAFKGHILSRGQLITTYGAIAEALTYSFRNSIIRPSIKEIRNIISWLQSEGMITVKPLTDGAPTRWGRPPDLTRAYVGLLITVINYDPYQDLQSYSGRGSGRPPDEVGQLSKEVKKEYTMSGPDSDFDLFYKSYPKHEARAKAFKVWKKIHPDSDLQNTILTAIENQKEHKAGLRSRNEFCPEWPMPATWLNQRRWEDETPQAPEPARPWFQEADNA